MARTIKSVVKQALDESESEIMELMKLHGIINKVRFEKVKSRLQNALGKELKKVWGRQKQK